MQGGIFHGAFFNLGNAGGDRYHYPRTDERFRGVDLLYEVAQHRFGDLEIRYDAVPHRPYRDDVAGCASQHPLRLFTDRYDVGGAGLDRDNGRLAQDYTLVLQIDKRCSCAEVYPHIIGE